MEPNGSALRPIMERMFYVGGHEKLLGDGHEAARWRT